jgi:hypothetical protein
MRRTRGSRWIIWCEHAPLPVGVPCAAGGVSGAAPPPPPPLLLAPPSLADRRSPSCFLLMGVCPGVCPSGVP